MRNDSESFNLLYSFFESSEEYHITIEVNDKKVDDRAKEQGSSEEDAKKYEGFYSPEGSITLRSNASSTAISEEFFHGFQRQYMYNNTRNSSEIESEAKLYNYTVRGELYPDVPAGRSGLDSYFPLISGNPISNKNAYSIYRQYIDAYNRLSEQTPDHPYSKYKVRYLAPHAYNYLMYLKNQK